MRVSEKTSSISGNSCYWGDSGASPHMLRELKLRGSQGFIIGLPVANMHLPGMRRVGVLQVQFLFPALLLEDGGRA